jgi:membrane protein DedA with SNARE-associated domain
LNTLRELAEVSPWHGYLILFAGVMLENTGIPLPGETALLAAAFLASAAGGAHLNIWFVVLAAFTGAVIGDNLGYWIGRELARPRLAGGKRFLFLTPERMRMAEGYFARYGALTVFFGRFVALLRIAAGPAAGVAGMEWWRFFLANATGAAVWASAIGLIGYAAGPAWQQVHRWLGWSAWVLVGAVVLGALVWHVVPYLRRARRSDQKGSDASPSTVEIRDGS